MIKKFIHQWAWVIFITFCIVGLFYPIIGSIALLCMLAPVILAFFAGRMWCGNFCPRGSFNDMILKKLSKKRSIPGILKTNWFRITFMVLLMTAFTLQLVFAWGDMLAVGKVFVRIIIATTLIAIILGIAYNQRTWCAFCPMGTLAHFITNLRSINTKIPKVTFDKTKCINCKLCTKNCPIGIDVLAHKEAGLVANSDCLKCNVCIEKCPKKALNLT